VPYTTYSAALFCPGTSIYAERRDRLQNPELEQTVHLSLRGTTCQSLCWPFITATCLQEHLARHLYTCLSQQNHLQACGFVYRCIVLLKDRWRSLDVVIHRLRCISGYRQETDPILSWTLSYIQMSNSQVREWRKLRGLRWATDRCGSSTDDKRTTRWRTEWSHLHLGWRMSS
jgi:hypothetical protein